MRYLRACPSTFHDVIGTGLGAGIFLKMTAFFGEACQKIMNGASEKPEDRPGWLIIHAEVRDATAVRVVYDFLTNLLVMHR